MQRTSVPWPLQLLWTVDCASAIPRSARTHDRTPTLSWQQQRMLHPSTKAVRVSSGLSTAFQRRFVRFELHPRVGTVCSCLKRVKGCDLFFGPADGLEFQDGAQCSTLSLTFSGITVSVLTQSEPRCFWNAFLFSTRHEFLIPTSWAGQDAHNNFLNHE